MGNSPYVVDGELRYQRSGGIEAVMAERVEVTNRFLDNNRTDLKDMIDNDYGRSAAWKMTARFSRAGPMPMWRK